jgi:ABC-type oligopeptide transport system ATPase subunit
VIRASGAWVNTLDIRTVAKKSKTSTRAPKRAKRIARKPAKKVAARPSTTRSTAGPGFDFEDRVAAWLLLKALTGQPTPGTGGTAARLQMQVEALGWTIDDILLTSLDSPNNSRQLAISCKSNVQVTNSGLPPDFVARCWQQWFKPDPNPVRRDQDSLALVTRGTNNVFMATWSELKNAAPGTDIALAIGRMRAASKQRSMFDSVKSPAKDAGVTVSDADVVAMVNAIAVIPLDFHIADSEDEKKAIAQCRALLVNGSLAEGARLWKELITQAGNTRLGSGTLDIPELWRRLRVSFSLKDHPDFEASWRRLRALTDDYKATIETTLSTAVSLDRVAELDELVATVSQDLETVIFGESGSGKSALVKVMLDDRFPDAGQVWFGPDNLDLVLNEATREGLGISQPLNLVLDATARAENFLVIDAAERLNRGCALKAKSVIEGLVQRHVAGTKPPWRVLIVTQTDAWVNGTIQDLATTATPKNFAVKTLQEAEVKDVLRGTLGLEWLATHEDAVSALTNFRTLAWVVQATARFQDSNGELSLSAIADRLWAHWTDSKPSVQRLLLQLGEREASFEHSFALSAFESGDAAVLDNLPIACPLRRDDATGRIRFQHDLASDWARFQRLKEIQEDTAKWSVLAGNPFWHGALRMLAQLLLRKAVGSRTAWDVAFEAAEKNREAVPLADHVLLDALFLDPNAEAFLDARAGMLFENNGARLLRLVNRFDHVATVPGASAEVFNRYRDISLYIEAQFRTPIIGRWPAMARFLVKHRDRVAKMASPAIAGLCERWLTSLPPTLGNGIATPYRHEFADLALANAREMQAIHAKGVMVLGDSERLYQAAFAGTPDLPAEISQWALEMARRRPLHKDIVEQVKAYRIEQAKEHKERLKSDLDYRKRHARRERIPVSIGSFREKLPPWPLGGDGRIEGRFREAVLRSVNFQAMMRTVPDVAAEVLLACIVEDEPEREHGSRSQLDRELGIESDRQGYPTAPWKSPFYAFLQINRDAALEALHKLINFATERWVQVVTGKGSAPTPLSLRLSDGTTRKYAGNGWVFRWSHENSLFLGQLHAALAALEKWLCDLVDAGKDVAPEIEALLQTTNSVSVLGVLVNVGKHKPEFFKGPLRPLLGLWHAYEWDSVRAKTNAYSFDAGAWARGGDLVFEMAKAWSLAPYRQTRLRDIVPTMLLSEKELAEYVAAGTKQWNAPTTGKEALEFRILVAELDYKNYTATTDPGTGKPAFEFAYPQDVESEIASFRADHARLLQALTLPEKCTKVLNNDRLLTADEAEWVASLMAAIDGDEEIDVEKETLNAPRVGAAAVLVLRAPDWLAANAVARERAIGILDAAIAGITDDVDDRGRQYMTALSHLQFAAYFAFDRWMTEPSKENDERVLRLLTSGDEDAVSVLVALGYHNRAALGQRWWRFLYLALLWSGLTMLAPRLGDDESDGLRWQRWRLWLRKRSLSVGAGVEYIDPLKVAERVERFELNAWRRRSARDGMRFVEEPGRRLSGGLETHFLQRAFGWLFLTGAARTVVASELETHRRVVAAFWVHQAWWLSGSGKDENDDYQPMHEFGYAILGELGRLIMESAVDTGRALWEPVFALGAKGHYAIGHFLSSWFALVTDQTNSSDFAKRWRAMVEFCVLNKEWAKGERDGPAGHWCPPPREFCSAAAEAASPCKAILTSSSRRDDSTYLISKIVQQAVGRRAEIREQLFDSRHTHERQFHCHDHFSNCVQFAVDAARSRLAGVFEW